MFNNQLLTYSFLVFLLTMTPGADTMLVLRNVFSSGKRSGILTTLGISTGLLVYAILSALGISLIFANSYVLYQSLKTLGAFYLIYLGFQSFRFNKNAVKFEGKKHKLSHKKAYIQGFLSNVLNPKIMVFYLTFMPQFISPQDNTVFKSFVLAGIAIILAIAWFSFLSIFVGSIKFLYSSPKVRHSLEVISGLVMIIFAIILLFEEKL